MRTVAILKAKGGQIMRIPKEMEFTGVTELEIRKDDDTLVLRPVRPSWLSLADELLADSDFLGQRTDVIAEGRFDLNT